MAMAGNYVDCTTLLTNTCVQLKPWNTPRGRSSPPVLELKLDQAIMFEWLKHSQGSKEVPDFNEPLEFLDLRARATENAREKNERKHYSMQSSKKTVSKPSYAVSADEACVLCKTGKHPPYACERFKTLPHQ